MLLCPTWHKGVFIHTPSFEHLVRLRRSPSLCNALQPYVSFSLSGPDSLLQFSKALIPTRKANSIIEFKQKNFSVSIILICQGLSRQFTNLQSRKQHIKIINWCLRRCMNTQHFMKRNYTALVMAEWSRPRKNAYSANWRRKKVLTCRHVWKQELFFSARDNWFVFTQLIHKIHYTKITLSIQMSVQIARIPPQRATREPFYILPNSLLNYHNRRGSLSPRYGAS